MYDLSRRRYREMIATFKEAGYQFYKFQDVDEKKLSDPIVLWRHDVDFAIGNAIEIAQIEFDLGITSTFFVQLRSPLYNTLSDYVIRAFSLIHEQGHDIALHFDLSLYSTDYWSALSSEIDLLSFYCPFVNTGIISFHRPARYSTDFAHLRIGHGIRHTYEQLFVGDFKYFSDSGGHWRNGDPIKSREFERREPMHILTHPLWWTEAGEGPVEKLGSYIRASNTQVITLLEESAVSFSLDALRSGTLG